MTSSQVEKTCPSCGSKNIDVQQEERTIPVPLAQAVSYNATIDHCRDCGMDGDFLGVNDKAIESLVDNAKKASMTSIISGLVDDRQFSMAYMERALDLPARTMMRWKSGDYSAAALALLRIIGTYPWTIEVADAKFDGSYATKRLVQEGFNAMCRIAETKNIWTSIAFESSNIGLEGTFQFYLQGKKLPTTADTGLKTKNPPLITNAP